jgi:hypothetical protein
MIETETYLEGNGRLANSLHQGSSIGEDVVTHCNHRQ